MKTFILTAVITLLSFSTFAQNNQPMHQPAHPGEKGKSMEHLKRLEADLQLDQTQIEWVNQIWSDTQRSISPYRKELNQLVTEYNQLVASSTPDYAALDKNVDQQEEVMHKISKIHTNEWMVMTNVLNTDQMNDLKHHLPARHRI